MDAAKEPTESVLEGSPEDDNVPVESDDRKPTSARSSAEVADTVSSTYARLARPRVGPDADH